MQLPSAPNAFNAPVMPPVPGGVAPAPVLAPNFSSAPAGVAPLLPAVGDVTGPTGTATNATPAINGPVAPAAGPEAPKTRKPRAKRATFRAPDAPKLESVPDTYSRKLHLPLAKEDFAKEEFFYDYKANESRKTLAKYEQLAAECRSGETPEVRKNKEKLRKALDTVKAMEPALRAQMGDEAFDKMISSMGQQQVNNAAAVAAGV